MHTHEHNKGSNRTRLHLATLCDLREFVGRCDIPTAKKSQIRSAIKRTDELVGHGALDLPAEPRRIFERLEAYSPAMAGMSAGALANLKSRLRAAFRLAEPRLERAKVKRGLEGAWEELRRRLDVGDQRTLSRLLCFAHAQGWEPQDISDAHMDRFRSHLQDEVLVVDWEGIVRDAIRAWNRLAIEKKHGALSRLTPPVLKRTPYWIDVATWPSGLREDMDAFLEHLAKPSCFTGASARKLKPTTIQQYRHNIRILVSSVVARGARLESMQRLADVVIPANVDRALMFLHERSGGRVTHQMFQLMLKTRTIAEWCGHPDDIRASLDKMFEAVKNELPRRRGLTAKNRELLDRLDDQRFRDLIYMLPQMWFDTAKKTQGKWSPAMARTAIAVELLITCSMRRENLVKLELDRSIRKIGQPPNDYWIIEIAPEQVKNEEPLRFTLPEPTAELLENYLADWRPKLCEVPSAWLFPRKDGGPMDPKMMSYAITSLAQKTLGTRITPHQFRHISAELFLREQPDGLYTISQHLGHRDPNTTRTYYARSKQREASRRYQERVVLDRAEAKKRLRITKRREGDTP